MKFANSKIDGCHRVELEKHGDERGFFARLFCEKELLNIGLNFNLSQANDSFSADKGTLRGMHYQKGNFSETKIIRCLKGSIYDVVIDLRPSSGSYLSWEGFHLDERNRSMVVVPKGCAHGFITLEENTEVFYLVDAMYAPQYEAGVRWNDPLFNIKWPIAPMVISEKDQNWEEFVNTSS
jgi:dTDP-4-dehydrorhamnose 3,5-epimerase